MARGHGVNALGVGAGNHLDSVDLRGLKATNFKVQFS
jgi:hypothetical protein